MCERYGLKNTIQYAQYTIWWMDMDKRRPAIIVSNNWFNTVANGFLVASVTTKQFDDTTLSKEYGSLMVQFIGVNRDLCYIKLSDLKFIPKSDFGKIKSNDFYGVLTDMIAINKISEIMQGIMNPNYMGYHLTTEYITENIKVVDNVDDIESPSVNTPKKPIIVVVGEHRGKKPVDKERGVVNITTINDSIIGVPELRKMIDDNSCDDDIALEFLKNRQIIDDKDLLINTIVYISNNRSRDIRNRLGMSPSGISHKLHSVIKFANEQGYITAGAADMVKTKIVSNRYVRN